MDSMKTKVMIMIAMMTATMIVTMSIIKTDLQLFT